jgi:hypothetical protein
MAAADAVYARVRPNRFHRRSGLSREPIKPVRVLDGEGPLFGGDHLQMLYDEDALGWIFDRLHEKRRHGDLNGTLLTDDASSVGWYLFYVRPTGTAELVCLWSRPGSEMEVLKEFFSDAWKIGAHTARGYFSTALARPVSALHGTFNFGAPWTLAYSRTPEIMSALHRGDARLSRLDMEFWMRFTGG